MSPRIIKLPPPVLALVGHHHHVLAPIEAEARSGWFKQPGVLLQLDSHDDLGVPILMSSEVRSIVRHHTVSGIPSISEAIDINNWILPCILAGYFDHVVWVHAFASFATGVSFSVGLALERADRHADHAVLFVTDGDIDAPMPVEWRMYWGSQYVARAAGTLLMATFTVTVLAPDSDQLRAIVLGREVTVSVDLDFFSTLNPAHAYFKQLLSEYPGAAQDLIDGFSCFTPAIDTTLGMDVQRLLTNRSPASAKRRLIDALALIAMPELVKRYGAALTSLMAVARTTDRPLTGKRRAQVDKISAMAGAAFHPHHASTDSEIDALVSHAGVMLTTVRAAATRYNVVVATSPSYTPEAEVKQLTDKLFTLMKTPEDELVEVYAPV